MSTSEALLAIDKQFGFHESGAIKCGSTLCGNCPVKSACASIQFISGPDRLTRLQHLQLIIHI